MTIVSLIRFVFLVFLLFLALSFFGISIQAIVDSPAGFANYNYLYHLLTQFWQWATLWIRPTGS